jgi:hypothetical protein
MHAIDYLSVYLLLGAAPTWQAGLDKLSGGLGSALLVILLISAIRTTQINNHTTDRSRARSSTNEPFKRPIQSGLRSLGSKPDQIVQFFF